MTQEGEGDTMNVGHTKCMMMRSISLSFINAVHSPFKYLRFYTCTNNFHTVEGSISTVLKWFIELCVIVISDAGHGVIDCHHL